QRGVRERRVVFIAHAVVDRQLRTYFEIVLREISLMRSVRRDVGSGVGDPCAIRESEQEVRERVPAEHAVETILAQIVAREKRDVVAIGEAAEVGAELESVPPIDPAQII